MGRTGLELSAEAQGKPQSDTARANFVATERNETPKFDPDLQAIIDAWPAMRDKVKSAIMALVE